MKKYLILLIVALGILSCGKTEKVSEKSSDGKAETCAITTDETKSEEAKVVVPKGEEITVDGKEVTILNKRIKVGDKLEDAELRLFILLLHLIHQFVHYKQKLWIVRQKSILMFSFILLQMICHLQ